MSGYFFKAVATSLLAVVLAGLLKRDSGSIAAAMIIAVGVVILLMTVTMLQPVMDELQRLADASGFRQAYLVPILKCTGIGIITQIAVSICRDAGESALASILELCGCVLAIFFSLPLFSAVLQLISSFMEA